MTDALVIGAGPAGLMAAAELARAGRRVVIAEAKTSPARKFLMAGKSGLNLTKAEPLPAFLGQYDTPWLQPIVAAFGPEAVIGWAEGLGVEVFTGSTGRVFPRAMKASPLLRAWLAALAGMDVELRTGWRWTGFDGDSLVFGTPEGRRIERPKTTVLALGGASWARLGSDATWVPWLAERGVEVTPFAGSNLGWRIDWSDHMALHFGRPVKAVALTAGGETGRGEFVLSRRGIEGGGIYALTRPLRAGARLTLDLVPDLDVSEVARRLARAATKDTASNRLRKALGLAPVHVALLQEWARPLTREPAALARLVKALPVPLKGPRPMDEAISTAGGIAASALTADLELRALPGIYACGEMLDWDAPTGGYLLTACLATGRWAGRAAAKAD
ncbi:MAG TPA: TIGR03862 family flavoprotein [Albidovulum sp.]|uniref:TIGR03862 family flavoprotein n=1 Tax=Albidovulum sp. TaxID=1872424 RepID=UPI002B9AF5C5|nr:TIGR03862 family flavoprotein [Albidovulum sp.]